MGPLHKTLPKISLSDAAGLQSNKEFAVGSHVLSHLRNLSRILWERIRGEESLDFVRLLLTTKATMEWNSKTL